MRLSTLATFIAVAASATAQTLTGQYDCTPAGQFTLCQNLWGKCTYSAAQAWVIRRYSLFTITHETLGLRSAAGVGNQNSTLLSASGSTVSWRTQWQWQNNQNNVKSYANVISNTAKGVQLSALTSAPTAWSWVYESESSGIRADVS